MESGDYTDISSKLATKFQEYLVFGSSRNATFALHMDMMRHCDDVFAIYLSEPIREKDCYGLLLAAVKSSLLFSFVNNASTYARRCVRLLCCQFSTGYYHRCLKELHSTQFRESNRNFACDKKREFQCTCVCNATSGWITSKICESISCDILSEIV